MGLLKAPLYWKFTATVDQSQLTKPDALYKLSQDIRKKFEEEIWDRSCTATQFVRIESFEFANVISMYLNYQATIDSIQKLLGDIIAQGILQEDKDGFHPSLTLPLPAEDELGL